MNLSLEKIDEMRKRTHCSYEEAKELLEKHNGDILEAIVEFEKKHRGGFNNKHHNHHHNNGHSFGEKVRGLIHKGSKTRFIIEKEKNTIINISVNVLIIVAIIAMPVFWVLPIAVIAAYFMGYKIKIRKEKGEDIDVNKMVDDVGSKVKTSTEKNTKEAGKEEANEQKEKDKDDDGINEITVE